MIKKIKELRDQTGAPLLLIKEALQNSENDLAKAKEWLNRNWHSSNRMSGFSVINSYVHNNRIGVMIEVSCGSDFVALNHDFRTLCHELLLQLVAGLPGDLEKQLWIKSDTTTVADMVEELSKKTGEPIKIERYIRWET